MRSLWIFVLCLVGGVAVAFAAQESRNWQTHADWSPIFRDQEVVGTAIVFDETENTWHVFDRARAERGYSPASTFKIFNALVALETGAIKDEFEVIRWDGKKRDVEAWNRDTSLASGMKHSVVWFYQEIARRVGAERMQNWMDRVDYGNRDISGDVDRFWLDGGLRISAVEQIGFLRRLAKGALPFSESTQETVRRITITETATDWTLHSKTGWGLASAQDGKTDLGWVIGWVERGGKRWFFAVNIDMPKAGDAAKRMLIARNVLQDVGAFSDSPR